MSSSPENKPRCLFMLTLKIKKAQFNGLLKKVDRGLHQFCLYENIIARVSVHSGELIGIKMMMMMMK